MIRLHDLETGAELGTITKAQLDFLMEQLEEESGVDQDYYLDAGTLAMLEDAGADAELVRTLRAALGDREGVEIAWSEA